LPHECSHPLNYVPRSIGDRWSSSSTSSSSSSSSLSTLYVNTWPGQVGRRCLMNIVTHSTVFLDH
jgi:hypothetical protein